MKIALISHVLPPAESGQAMIIYRLLQELVPDDYCLLSTRLYDPNYSQDTYTRRLPGKYYHLPAELPARGARLGLYKLHKGIRILSAVIQQGRRIAEIIRREACEAVVACTGEVSLLPAGYLASRLTGVPFYAYIFDHYSYREWDNLTAQFLAKRFEPLLMKGAASIIVPNEVLRDDLRAKYGIETTLIHNSCDVAAYQTPLPDPLISNDREVKIVYTGAIYEAHYDAFQNLLSAIKLLGDPQIKLHLYTALTIDQLEARGICGPIVYHPHHAESEMPQIQRQADLLFLPLAFNSPYPNLIRTSATTKLGEYLAARRPILAHVPADSFVSWYFRQHDCGVVVDELNTEKLAQAIGQIINDRGLQQRLATRAWEQAKADFDIVTAQAAFAKLLRLEMTGTDRSQHSAYWTAEVSK